MILYKLTFTDNITFDDFIEGFEDEDGVLPFDILFQGNVPVKAEYDEDGININEGMHYSDYAVDILSKYEFNDLDTKLIEEKTQYFHIISGYQNEIKTK